MTTARRIARELAVIVMPQLPKDKKKLAGLDIEVIVGRAVRILTDYAKQNLSDANALLIRASQQLLDVEIEHPDNARVLEDVKPVNCSTDQLRSQIELIERSLHLVAEALDIPDMALHSRSSTNMCINCGQAVSDAREAPDRDDVKAFLIKLITTYAEHREEIDNFIKRAKAKWHVDRMVSIDRDILRLACTEAFYLPDVPLNVCISEAVELAHRFADETAAKFINGVLADLAKEAQYFRYHGELKDSASDNGHEVRQPSTSSGSPGSDGGSKKRKAEGE